MKNFTVALLFSCILIVGCRKSPETDLEEKTYPVSFSASNFVQKQGATTFADTSLSGIHFYIFKSSGEPVFSPMHTLKTENGSLNLTVMLPEGEYKIIFLNTIAESATNKQLSVNTFNISAFDPQHHLFYAALDFSVGKENEPHPITLQRVTGELEIHFLDKNFPDSVTSLQFIWREVKNYDFYNRVPLLTDEIWRFNALLFPERLNPYRIAILNPNISWIYIKCTNNTRVVEKTIPIKIYPNKRTILTGYIFGAPGADFKISVNPVWEAEADSVRF